MHEFLMRLVPTRFEAEVGAVCGFVGWIVETALGMNDAIGYLLAAMVLDYITGILAAAIYKRKHPKSKRGLDSRVGALGILKKVVILSIVAFSYLVDKAVAFDGVQAVVTWFYIGNEGLSIIENAAKAGAPIPRKLLDVLEQLAGDKERAENKGGNKA